MTQRKPREWAQKLRDDIELDLMIYGTAIRKVTWDKKKKDVKVSRVDPLKILKENKR